MVLNFHAWCLSFLWQPQCTMCRGTVTEEFFSSLVQMFTSWKLKSWLISGPVLALGEGLRRQMPIWTFVLYGTFQLESLIWFEGCVGVFVLLILFGFLFWFPRLWRFQPKGQWLAYAFVLCFFEMVVFWQWGMPLWFVIGVLDNEILIYKKKTHNQSTSNPSRIDPNFLIE